MTDSASALPASLSTASIVDGCDLRFDAGDKANGSLYVCTPRGAPAPDALIAALRTAGLWSQDAVKQVEDGQRQAYRDGLEFVAAAAFRGADGEVLLARFDHPKFPSDGARWQAWLEIAGATCERQG
jgi:hypothetical protein